MAGIEGLLAGRVLADRYHIEKVIGRGGMGAVYRATDQRLGRPVAVKVIMVPTSDAETQERLRARFLREAQAAARLRHPNVVTVHDFGVDQALGLDYLVMALLEGEDLATWVARNGPLAPPAAAELLTQAARGLAAGHRAGMVHRDVKPGNLFLEEGEGGRVELRVLDFGIAQLALEDTLSSLTVAGQGPLSPAYASPEQLAGETRLTAASDVFSLGAVALFTLTGERPFATPASRSEQSVVDAALARLDGVPGVDEGLRAVLARALHPDAAARFPDADALRAALEAVRAGSESDALRLAAASFAPVAAPPVDAADDDVTRIGGDVPPPRPPADPDDVTQIAPPPIIPPAEARLGEGVSDGPPVVPLPADEYPRGPAPRRRRSWVMPAALAATALGAMAVFGVMQGGDDAPRAVATVEADSAAVADSLALADSLAREDSTRVAQEREDSIQAAEAVEQARRDSAERIRRARDSILRAPPPADTGLIRLPRGASNRGGDRGGDRDRVYTLGEVERGPELRNRDDVARQLARSFPRGERRAGQALVRFVVDRRGRVPPGTVNVVSASDPAFEQSARRVVERLRFEPARRGGEAVAVRAELPLNWNP